MGDFELDTVLYFMLSKGGRVRNHELVTHFKNFLNHPVNKAANREKFKDYVNELASIKIDEGEKVLVLKRKYRPPSDDHDTAPVGLPFFQPLSGAKSGGASKKANTSEPELAGAPESTSSASTPASSLSASTQEPVLKDSRSESHDTLRAHSEPPAAVSAAASERERDNPDGLTMSKVRSDETMEVKMRRTDRLPPSCAAAAEDNVSMGSITGSNASLASAGSQKSQGSSTSGVASMEEDSNVSVISVKDKIKKLNKNISESDLNQPRPAGTGGGNKKNYKHAGGDDDDNSHSYGFVTLDSEQKDWLVVCSSSDYHDMNRLLSRNPGLAKLQDFTNGYTALHWAAKHGKAEVIKLVANKPGVNVDQRSNGGYTALHLAAIYGQEHIIELLVQTYKADANLRDYSGKKAKQYLKNSASSKAQPSVPGLPRPRSYHELLVSRRLGSDQSQVKILDDSFIRSASMRMSNRAKAMSTLLQAKSVVARQPLLRSSWNGSSDDMYEGKDRRSKTPPTSASSSPGSSKKKQSPHLMPPPESATRKMQQSARPKSSSRETSPGIRIKNNENQNMIRSGSDPGMLEKTASSTTV